MEDPNYKRAEAIKEIIQTKGHQYVESAFYEALQRRKEQDRKANETKWERIKERVAESLTSIRDNASKLWGASKDTIKTAEKTIGKGISNIEKNLNISDSMEEGVPSWDDTYEKLQQMKETEKILSNKEVEKAICELETVPLDPSHIHDELIDNPDIYDTTKTLSENIPESLKAENPEYKRAEAIKQIITAEGHDVVHHEYLSEKDAMACIDKAIDELDRMSADPIFARERAIETLPSDQRYSEEEKTSDPNYKRAEAIKGIIQTRGHKYVEDAFNDAIKRRIEADKKSHETKWDQIKEKVAENLASIKDSAGKFWSTSKDTLVSAEKKAEEGISNIEETMQKSIDPLIKDKTTTQQYTNVNKGIINKDLSQKKELAQPLLTQKKETLTNYGSSNQKNFTSNLEVNKQGFSNIKKEDVQPKQSVITDVDLKAQVGVPDISKTHKYDHSGDKQKDFYKK